MIYYFFPWWLGHPIYFVASCWLASLYCFEYRWVYLGWDSHHRLGYFERHWLYFFGFGFPIGLVSYISPKFIDTGMFALIFPIFILTSAIAKPIELKSERFRKLRIFFVIQHMCTFLLARLEGRIRLKTRTRTNSKQT